MIDREQVIRGLKCRLAQQPQNGTCNGCAYFRLFTIDPECGWCDRTAITVDAIALLKEQKPVKPYDNPLGYYRCGNCGTHVHKYGEQDKYCPGCGMAVKWDARPRESVKST